MRKYISLLILLTIMLVNSAAKCSCSAYYVANQPGHTKTLAMNRQSSNHCQCISTTCFNHVSEVGIEVAYTGAIELYLSNVPEGVSIGVCWINQLADTILLVQCHEPCNNMRFSIERSYPLLCFIFADQSIDSVKTCWGGQTGDPMNKWPCSFGYPPNPDPIHCNPFMTCNGPVGFGEAEISNHNGFKEKWFDIYGRPASSCSEGILVSNQRRKKLVIHKD